MPPEIIGPSPAAILVADDDRTQCAIISTAAERLGYRVSCATSVDGAIRHLGAEPFQTVIVDLAIGERDGIELLRTISTLRPLPRVIIVSGCEERILNAAVRFALAAGIGGTVALPKPLEIAKLRDLLGSAAPQDRASAPAPDTTPMLPADLARGLRDGEIYPVFQPKIELASGRVAGCEALARWTSAEFGTVDPTDFIALAERSGQVSELTHAILEQSIACARDFTKRNPDFVMAVNVSAGLLSDIALPDKVERLLGDHGVQPRSLLLEITESVAMSDISRAIDILVRLRIKGIGIAIDDFGTGYSSLSALARMPFSELKIDQTFVQSCLTDPDLMKIVRGSVALAREFRMKVVAEGIEDQETLATLTAIGCDLGQGFLFSAPLPRDRFVAWTQDWAARDRKRQPAA